MVGLMVEAEGGACLESLRRQCLECRAGGPLCGGEEGGGSASANVGVSTDYGSRPVCWNQIVDGSWAWAPCARKFVETWVGVRG